MNAPFNDTSRDERLSAWLDGELPPAQADEVQAWLHAHPEQAAQVRLWAADRDALRARLVPLADEPVPERLQEVVWREMPMRGGLGLHAWPVGWQRLAAALALLVGGGVVGAGLAWRLHPSQATVIASSPTGWVQRAAMAHSVYVPEQRHPVEVSVVGKTAEESRAQEDHLAHWLTRRLNLPVKLFDLREQGFELVGGRLLPDAAGPSAQLMYQATNGSNPPARVTVYLRKPDEATPASFRYERQGDLGLFYWVEGGTGYALAGSLPREQLLALAESIYGQLSAVAPATK